MTEESMQCSSLEIYATECGSRGVCIDWRGKTNNICRKYCRTQKCVCKTVIISVLFSKHIMHLTIDYHILPTKSPYWQKPQMKAAMPESLWLQDDLLSIFYLLSTIRSPFNSSSFVLFSHTAYNCPANMEYKPCGSINPATCEPRYGKTKKTNCFSLSFFYFYLPTSLTKLNYFIIKHLMNLHTLFKIYIYQSALWKCTCCCTLEK